METSSTTTKKKIQVIQTAIQQLIDDSKQSSSSYTSTQLLSNLLSQLESVKAGEVVVLAEQSKEQLSGELDEVETKTKDVTEISKLNSGAGAGAEEIVKELKKLEKQNRTTHWLLSALILLTVVWQCSEVSLLLKLKDGLSHPFKSLGSMVAGMVKRPKLDEIEADKPLLSSKKNENDSILKLAQIELSDLIMNGGEE